MTGRVLDATEVLLSAVMATSDAELRAARAAAVGTDAVYRVLSQPWSPPAGCTAGAGLLGESHLYGARTSLVERLGRVTRRHLAEGAGVGIYLLPPVPREQAYAELAARQVRELDGDEDLDVDDTAPAGGGGSR